MGTGAWGPPQGTELSRRDLLKAGATLGLAAAVPLSSRAARSGRWTVPAGGRAVLAGGPAARAKGLGPGGSLLRPGSRPYPNLPAGTDTLPKIEHIVVLMMENHSFDDHLGMLGRGDGLTIGADGLPVNYNPDPAGGYVRSFHLPNTCGAAGPDPTQSWDASHICWDDGTNMGFVKACSAVAMGYWEAADIPFYHGMASQFPIGDRYFCSVMAQTYPNRRFLIAGTAHGDVSTDSSGISATEPPGGTIFDTLDAHGISWTNYAPDLPTCALFLPVYNRSVGTPKIGRIERFFNDAAAGRLPSFSLVDPYVNYSEESGDISIGEAYAAKVIDAVLSSPAWEKTALIWVYDEHGGWYDHVPPQPAVRPDNVAPEIHVPPDQPGAYDYTGFRVPCCVVSAWSRRDHVSHEVYDHTSILKLVETKWNLPALTYRDANALSMLDFFDFGAASPPFAEPPVLPAPLNPFKGPIPPSSLQTNAGFRPVCTPVPADSLPPAGFHVTEPPKNADALIAAHTKQALGLDEPPAHGPSAAAHSSSTPEVLVGTLGGAAVLAGAGVLAARLRRRPRGAPAVAVAAPATSSPPRDEPPPEQS